jgi:hypothetical protein
LHKCTGKQSASKWFLCVQKVNQKTGVRIPTSVVLLVEGGLLGYMEYAMRESGDPPSHYLVYVILRIQYARGPRFHCALNVHALLIYERCKLCIACL